MNDELEDGATTADERAPFLQTVEERVQMKVSQHRLELPAELQEFIIS